MNGFVSTASLIVLAYIGKASAGGNIIMDNKLDLFFLFLNNVRNRNLFIYLCITGSDSRKNFSTQLDSAKSRLNEILCLKFKLHAENDKIKLAIEAVKYGANDYKVGYYYAEICKSMSII
ncbi:hypothetical protein L6164_033381 [Bauhinia variegata]|uniref:Uncharacterized protein n=1 Tax=Bauhinia variegata TaxID=167791 RepID=A0ACB9KS89_BAUVA|nr:hypothetical protein L6164_033381 [Bauhinia variegata]